MNLRRKLYTGDHPGAVWLQNVKNFLCIQFGEGVGGGTMAAVCVKDRDNKEDLQATLDYVALFEASPRLLTVLRMIIETDEDSCRIENGNFAMWAKSIARSVILDTGLNEVGLDGEKNSTE